MKWLRTWSNLWLSRGKTCFTFKPWEAPHQCCCLGRLALELGRYLHRLIRLSLSSLYIYQPYWLESRTAENVLPSGQTGSAPSVQVGLLESWHSPWWGLRQRKGLELIINCVLNVNLIWCWAKSLIFVTCCHQRRLVSGCWSIVAILQPSKLRTFSMSAHFTPMHYGEVAMGRSD